MVPRMISAGKRSSTTIDRSRTTKESAAAAARARRRARGRPERVEIEFGDATRPARQSARLGDGRRNADDAERRPRRHRRWIDRRLPGDQVRDVAPARPHGDAERRAEPLDHPFDVEESTVARAAAPVLARRHRSRRWRRRALAARRERVPISKSRTSGVRAGGCARRRRPGRAAATAAGWRTSPTAGSRSRNRASSGALAGRQTARRRLRLDEAEGHRLGQPGSRQHAAHQLVARRRAGSGGGAAVSAGKVAASRSKP